MNDVLAAVGMVVFGTLAIIRYYDLKYHASTGRYTLVTLTGLQTLTLVFVTFRWANLFVFHHADEIVRVKQNDVFVLSSAALVLGLLYLAERIIRATQNRRKVRLQTN